MAVTSRVLLRAELSSSPARGPNVNDHPWRLAPSATTTSSHGSEYARKDRIDVLEVIVEVEQRLELDGREHLGHLRIGLQQRQEIALALPDRHGFLLHQTVGVLARHALLRKSNQHALRMHETTQPV